MCSRDANVEEEEPIKAVFVLVKGREDGPRWLQWKWREAH